MQAVRTGEWGRGRQRTVRSNVGMQAPLSLADIFFSTQYLDVWEQPSCKMSNINESVEKRIIQLLFFLISDNQVCILLK